MSQTSQESRGPVRRPHQYDRGRLMTASEIRTEVFRGNVSETWVRSKVAPKARRTIGARVMWYEYDVLDWVQELGDAA